MRAEILAAPGGEVAYWVGGAGDCVVLTHGATMDHGLFQLQADQLSEHHRVIVWDVPAHGRSRPYRRFTLPGAADVLMSILDQEGVKSAHLVGQSMGGYISQIAARHQPDRVGSLTVVGSSPLKASSFSAMDRFLLKLTPFLLRLYPYGRLISSIADQVTMTEVSRAYAFETLQGLSKAEIIAISAQVYEDAVANSTDEPLPVPVFITFGEHDRTGKVAAYSRSWAASEGHPLHVIPAAAHNANMDNPADFNRVLLDYLRARD